MYGLLIPLGEECILFEILDGIREGGSFYFYSSNEFSLEVCLFVVTVSYFLS